MNWRVQVIILEKFLADLFSNEAPIKKNHEPAYTLKDGPYPSVEEKLFLNYLIDYLKTGFYGNSKFFNRIEEMTKNLYWGPEKDAELDQLRPLELWEDKIHKESSRDNSGVERCQSWIMEFWEKGFNILEYLHLTRIYAIPYILSHKSDFIFIWKVFNSNTQQHKNILYFADFIGFVRSETIRKSIKHVEKKIPLQVGTLMIKWNYLQQLLSIEDKISINLFEVFVTNCEKGLWDLYLN
jgi:hypothetical protein